MILNEHVNVDTELSHVADKFYPDDGYALWMDDEEGNIDPDTGEPNMYWLQINVPKSMSEACAPHIWAKLIDETMEVYGKTPEQPVMKARASTMSLRGPGKEVEASHTYIDENGVERDKRGVY